MQHDHSLRRNGKEFKGHPGKFGCWKTKKRLLSIGDP